MRVAIVTCKRLPEPDPDEAPLLEALRGAGLDAELLGWDGARRGELERSPAEFDLCVLRSCWNYPQDPDGFELWLDRASRESHVLNPSAAVRWNLNKRYLLELERLGLPTVPTLFVERGERLDLAAETARRAWNDIVVKPAISAASFRTRRFERAPAEAQAFLDDLVAERSALVQPYLPAVEQEGERALVWIDGEWTHAVEKGRRFHGDDESVSAARPLANDERELAEQTLERLGDRAAGLLYGRLDLIPEPSGGFLISEVEWIEPSLFLVQHPPAIGRLVAAIARYDPANAAP